eukprot:GHVL01008105.1.p1 GENE.GHVL01008105.1~~GHVL01008105.1.p1  ORF type:complete len:140 (+),score=8.13 GHVL01008105.1:410-829(+)
MSLLLWPFMPGALMVTLVSVFLFDPSLNSRSAVSLQRVAFWGVDGGTWWRSALWRGRSLSLAPRLKKSMSLVGGIVGSGLRPLARDRPTTEHRRSDSAEVQCHLPRVAYRSDPTSPPGASGSGTKFRGGWSSECSDGAV